MLSPYSILKTLSIQIVLCDHCNTKDDMGNTQHIYIEYLSLSKNHVVTCMTICHHNINNSSYFLSRLDIKAY